MWHKIQCEKCYVGDMIGKDMNKTMEVKDVFFETEMSGLRFEAQGAIWQ